MKISQKTSVEGKLLPAGICNDQINVLWQIKQVCVLLDGFLKLLDFVGSNTESQFGFGAIFNLRFSFTSWFS